MNPYQKMAALIFRLVAVGIIIYSVVSVSSLLLYMPAMARYILPTFVSGIGLFIVSIPLARITTWGFGE